jgi:UDP-N-acetylmuramate--alanine ligase
MDIYPARELPMEGITSDWLSKIDNKNKNWLQKKTLLNQF